MPGQKLRLVQKSAPGLLYVFLHVEMKKKILIQAMPCFYGELLPTDIFSKPRPLR